MDNSNYISSLSFLQHSFVQGREILSSVLDVQNEEEGFLDVMQALGKLKPTSQPVYHSFVNEALYKNNTITISEAGSGTGKQTDITVSAAGNARVGDLMMGVSGNVYLIQKISASAGITFTPVDGAGVATDYDASGDKFVVFSNAQGEGSGSPDPIKYGLTKQSNRVQIFKNKYRISDVAKASKITVEYKGKPYFMYKGTYEALQRFRGDISNSLMFGKGSGDFYSGASVGDMNIEGNAVQTTNGLREELRSGGILESGSPFDFNSNVITTLVDLTKALNKARAPKDYWMWLGTDANIKMDNALNGLDGTGFTSARFNVDGKSIDLGIDKFSLYGRTWNKKQLSILDHNELGSTVTGSGEVYLIPTGQVKTAGGGGSQDYLQVRYLEGDGNNFSFRETLTGGLAPTPTSADSILDVNYQAIMGLEVLGKEHCALVTGF
tara:strand:- start:1741 stop:3054 length:1314 start_codon:yes stop_codon:yes gene_type:complete